ncbi:LOW QUALITY PROTEIN: MMS19 nucleotide excision repair protein homolog [Sceloporus undulatus]|uniref:LOW QUALITY PROTEIN: MMS19 nucleotide excision repair protein homolog n=1 Tax=Sceloporus undulatus TaxID=8520 RepID=UPI001C4C49D7|nr:LOW QUALITY PROTEIN: MMS19 nucleotide excision repair protein homolog [Sceloporus undulatus]
MAAGGAGEGKGAPPSPSLLGREPESEAREAAEGVKAGTCTILDVVENLGSPLENADPHIRTRGIQMLSEVLMQCYPLLREQEVSHLVLFYENRLKDHHIVIPSVLHGLKALSMCEVLAPGLAVSVLKAIFQEVHVQSLLQLDRHTVYSIITNFMSSREAELKSLGADFTFGFIQVMDGEKDPRNLLIAFQIVRDIIVNGYALGPFAEELFEVTSCYFPIDFNPPPNDPHGIQRGDLIVSLRAVLTSTPIFAEFLLPLLIEKMDSDVQSAKLDSLQTLSAACTIYGQKELKEFLPSLWSSLRREVFQTASEKIEAEGLSALNALSTCLSRLVLSSDDEDLLDSFLRSILQDCRHHLCEPDMKLVWPSAKLLQAAAGGSLRAYYQITSSVLPLLVEEYTKHMQSSQHRTILEVLLGFLELRQKWGPAEEDKSPLLLSKASLCTMVFSAVTEPNVQLQLVGIQALTFLGSLQGLLAPLDVEMLVDHLAQFILHETDSQTSLAAMEAGGTLAPVYPEAFSRCFVQKLSEELQSVSEVLEDSNPLQQECYLKALAAVSTHPRIVRETVPVLLQQLQQVQKDTMPASTQFVVSVCQSLQQVALKCQQDPQSYWYFHQAVVPCLLGLAVKAAMQENCHTVLSKVLLKEEALSAMVPVISAACIHLSPELAAQSASKVVPLFLDGELSFLSGNSFPSTFQPFEDGQCPVVAQGRLVALLMAFVCSLPKNVPIPQQDRLLRELLALSCSCDCLFTATAAAKCFAGLVNKHPAGPQLDDLLGIAMNKLEQGLNDGSYQSQALTLLLWVCKALLLRYHPLCTQLTNKLLMLLEDSVLGPKVGDGFILLMADSPDVLGKSSHAEVRLMFRQRFFTECVPQLVQRFHAAAPGMKSNYLKALSHILNHLPKTVLVTELPSLLSLLLEALSCPDHVVQLSTLHCLQPLLLDAPHIMSLHIDTLVGKFLNLTDSPAMAIRIAALQCLHALASLPTPVVIPYKPRVIKALAKPLDDKKRLVRKEAVTARGEWFLLGTPGR